SSETRPSQIQTFGLEAPCKTVEDLTSGIVMAQSFTLSLALSLSRSLALSLSLSLALSLSLSLSLALSAVLEYIQTIMMLEESVQHVVMTAIQELMSKECPVLGGNESYADIDRQLKKTVEDLNEALVTKEEIAQRCHELDMQVAALQEERGSLLAENQILMERLNQSDSIEDLNSPVGRRHLQLQTQLEHLQEETFRLEAAKDDYRIRCEELEKELTELRGQNEELTSLADEAQSLKDEMDVLRHSSDKVSKLEVMMESYKKKLEDLGDLRRQVKLLEEKNTLYMQNTVSLEEEVRKANTTRGQLESYKRQVAELQNRLSEESKKTDKMDFEYKRLKEKVDSLQKEKDRMRSERDSLKETIEELRCVKAQKEQLSTGMVPLGSNEGSDSLAEEIITPEIREKLIRLQHENNMLKLAQEGSDNEKISLLQSLLEDANSRKNELETENRLVNQRLIEGQSQVEELLRSLQEQGSRADDVSTTKLISDQKLREVNSELQKKSAYIEDLEPKYTSSSQKVEELEEALKKKDEDMKQMEDRYKKYLEKAKSVIRTLDPKQNQGSAPEVQALKNQLQEKERMLHSLEWCCLQRFVSEKSPVSVPPQGMALQKKAAEDRLASTGSGQSFLARQRQATSTRRSYPGHVQPTTAR
uniref:Hook microtubule tethering protein 3 n=1 Tax=Hucho hucho TaxID=62062 RepID=A0A4W5Q121_9TELE